MSIQDGNMHEISTTCARSAFTAKGGGGGKGGGNGGGDGKGGGKGGGSTPNLPSGTGNPSGGGRGNAPPSK